MKRDSSKLSLAKRINLTLCMLTLVLSSSTNVINAQAARNLAKSAPLLSAGFCANYLGKQFGTYLVENIGNSTTKAPMGKALQLDFKYIANEASKVYAAQERSDDFKGGLKAMCLAEFFEKFYKTCETWANIQTNQFISINDTRVGLRQANQTYISPAFFDVLLANEKFRQAFITVTYFGVSYALTKFSMAYSKALTDKFIQNEHLKKMGASTAGVLTTAFLSDKFVRPLLEASVDTLGRDAHTDKNIKKLHDVAYEAGNKLPFAIDALNSFKPVLESHLGLILNYALYGAIIYTHTRLAQILNGLHA